LVEITETEEEFEEELEEHNITTNTQEEYKQDVVLQTSVINEHNLAKPNPQNTTKQLNLLEFNTQGAGVFSSQSNMKSVAKSED
jgi:hypothetical protein